MKKTLTLLAAAICAAPITGLMAQSRFGIQAGGSLAKMNSKIDNIKMNSDMKAGFTAGIVADFGIQKNFAFQPSLNFTQKGFKDSEDNYSENVTLNYLELPVNFLYKTTDAGKGQFFAGGGPTFGYALSGKGKSTFNGESEEYDIEIGTGEDNDIKPFDLGVNIMAGYEFTNGLFLSANYSPSLINVGPQMNGEGSLKNTNFALRIGYLFGKKAGK